MQLKCPNCGAPVPPQNVNIQALTALCDQCGSVFGFGDRPSSRRAVKKQEMPKPQYVDANQTPDALDIKIKWSWRTEYPSAVIALVIGTLIACGFLWVMPVGRVVTTATAGAVIATTAFNPIFLFMFAIMALPLYVLLTLFINSTHIHFDRQALTRRGGPLPWFWQFRRSVPTDRIVSLDVRRMSATQHESPRRAMYNLYVLLDDDDEVLLLRGFNYAQSHYVLQMLESQLALFDSEDVFEDEPALDSGISLRDLDAPLIDGELPLLNDDESDKQAPKRGTR